VTGEEVSVLDLGCGTGLELEGILRRAPNARVTAVDLSERMLEVLSRKFAGLGDRLTLVRGSYVEVPLGRDRYDYVVSVQTMHHLLYQEKLAVYRRILEAWPRPVSPP